MRKDSSRDTNTQKPHKHYCFFCFCFLLFFFYLGYALWSQSSCFGLYFEISCSATKGAGHFYYNLLVHHDLSTTWNGTTSGTFAHFSKPPADNEEKNTCSKSNAVHFAGFKEEREKKNSRSSMWKCFEPESRCFVMNRIRYLSNTNLKTVQECRRKCSITSKRFLCSNVKSSGLSDDKKKYSNTLLLPTTSFPLRIEPKDKPGHDYTVSKTAEFASLYKWQRDTMNGEEFVLHDGPPYANGSPHIGHAVNKILKDVILRNKLLDGHKIHYVPGWDCHGLPIELKAFTDKKDTQSKLSPTEIREKARSFAQTSINSQLRSFKFWGLLADWEDCYYTYSIPYIENELQQFYKLYEKGYIYRNFLPTYWSPSSKTALAEAELEYNQQHKSTCVFFRLKMQQSPLATSSDNPMYALIWTTTPWTLPANAAVGFNPEMEYSLISIDKWDGAYIVASPLVTQLEETMGTKVTVQRTVPGVALEGSTYQHPIKRETFQPFLPADFVSADKGTGLVHIAPSHGHDDFALGKKYNLPVNVLVDNDGMFLSEAGPGLEGLPVLGLGGGAVRLLLEDDILHTHKIIHSYPYDWRTREPVIISASKQWFMSLDSVKPLASSIAANIPVLPENLGGKENLLAKINSRSYWCISRQRIWGVPIPILFLRESDTPIVSKSLIDHYCNLLKQRGTDFWWTLSNAELCPVELAEENRIKAGDIERLQRSSDILDIWLDSGLSWSSVLQGRTADLYLEGVDQCTGWFQSSLLTSVALQERPPCKSIFVHGFVVDENGNKMSKSLGNVIDPHEVIFGGKNKAKNPPFGTDVFRWWVAGHTVQHSNIPIGTAILKDGEIEVQKLRGILRHILGNLGRLTKIPNISLSAREISSCIIDRYILHELFQFNQQISGYYKNHQFNLVRIAVINFISNQLSATYLNIIKDRMYCSELTNPKRLSSQIILFAVLEVLLRSVGPIVPFLTEEICQHHVCFQDTTYFRRQALSALKIPNTWNDPTVQSEMKIVFDVKHVINKMKASENTWNLHAVVRCGKKYLEILKVLNEEDSDQLLEIFQLRSLEILPSDDELLSVELNVVHTPLCLRCRRNSILPDSDICPRCLNVLEGEREQKRHHAS